MAFDFYITFITIINIIKIIFVTPPKELQKGFLRITKKALISYLILSIVILSSGLLYLFNPFTTHTAQAAWFNEDWGYRKAITITVTSNSSDITNLQTLLTVDTTGITSNLQSSCQDLRFTSVTGILLPYYIDSCTNNSATNKIWVLIDLVPKNTTTYTMYMYYGNPAAAAASSAQPWFDNLVSLKGYWTLNDNTGTTAKDSSIDGYNGTLTNSPSWSSSGKYSNAISLAGGAANDYVDLTDQDAFTPTSSGFTLEAWVNYTTFQNNGSQVRGDIVAKDPITATGNWEWNMGAYNFSGTTNPVFQFYTLTSAGSFLSQAKGTTVAAASTWYHVAGTVDSSGVARVYVNGTLEGTGATAAFPTNQTETMKIGTSYGSGVRWNTNGVIDDVKIYTTARTASQILGDYNNQLPNGQTATIATTAVGTIVPSTSFATAEKAPYPQAFWKFDDGTGTTAKDSSTNAANGTLAGTTKPTWQTEDQCVSGKCLYFDGSTSKVTVATAVNGVMSVSMWVKPNTLTSTLIDLDGGTHKITSNSSGALTATGFTSPTIYVNGVSGASLTANTWNYVTVTTGTSFNTTSSLTIATDGTTLLKGFVDEVKLYNYARSQAQVNADLSARGNPQGVSSVTGTNPNNFPGTLSNGLVGYWKMDESSGNAADSSGNGTTLTNNNTTTFAAGKFGNASSYNGTTQYFSTASTISGVQTVSFWVNPASNTNNYVNLTSTAYITSSAGTVSATGFTSPSIYVNGALNGTITASAWNLVTVTTGTGISSNQVEVGRANSLYLSNTSKMDEVRVYNRALSPSEISQLYNFAPGPVGYWKFDENTGAAANDSSGNADSGTVTGSPSWVPGKYGSALNYNGSSQYTSITAGTSLQITNALTVEGWINPAAASNFVLFKETTGGNGDWWINFSSGNWQCATAGGTGIVSTGVSAALNQWTHITLAYTASSLKCYVNGVPSGTTDTTPGTLTGNTNAVMVAGYPTTPTTYFNGSVDDVRIYNYERTPDQIISDMNAGHPPVGSPVSSPVGYWKFDEGYGTTAHNSGNQGSTLNGVLTSSPTWTDSGKFGKALSFNGTTSYISQALVTATKPANLTFTAWIKPTVNNANQMIADLEPAGSGADGRGAYILLDTNGKLNLCKGSATGSYTCLTGAITVSTTAWHHLTGTYDGATMKVYVDGVLDNSSSSSTAISYTDAAASYPTPGQFYIGAHKTNAVGSGNTVPDTYFFSGLIDEVKLYNFALTPDQVKLDMNRSSAQVLGALSDNSTYQVQAANQEYCVPGDSTSCAAPVGRWDFEEGSGTAVNDSSNNTSAGTLTNGPTWTNGKTGFGIKFDGVDDQINLPNISFGASFTLEAWIKRSAANGTFTILDFNDNTNICYLRIGDITNNAADFACSGSLNATDTANISDGKWHFVVGVKNGSADGRVYVDGVQIAQDTVYTTAASFTSTQSRVGRELWNGTNYFPFDGSIDNVRVFNYARTASQIAWDYNKGGPVGYWKMDDCQGTIAHDSSGNGNNGTLNIATTGTQTTTIGYGTCTSNAATPWYNGRTGKINYSVNFDGTDDIITTAAFSPLATAGQTTTKISWGGWFYPTTSAASKTLLEKATEFQLTTDANSKPICGVYYSAAFHNSAAPPTALTLSAWNHLMCTYDGTNINTYLNGVLIKQSSETNNVTAASSILYFAETSGGANSYSGQIDDAKIFNYALTATQIKALYNNGAASYAPSTGAP